MGDFHWQLSKGTRRDSEWNVFPMKQISIQICVIFGWLDCECNCCLVGGLEDSLFSIIYGIILPID